MSLIVAIKDRLNKTVLLAADTQITAGDTQYNITNPNSLKIFPVSGSLGQVWLGGVGALRDINLIYTARDLVDELAIYKKEINFDYIVNVFVPRIFDRLNSCGRLIKEEKRPPCMQSGFMVVCQDKIWTIDSDGCVIEWDDYAAMGSGAKSAYGYLSRIPKKYFIDEKAIAKKGKNTMLNYLLRTVQAGADNNTSVSSPIVWTDIREGEANICTPSHRDDYEEEITFEPYSPKHEEEPKKKDKPKKKASKKASSKENKASEEAIQENKDE